MSLATSDEEKCSWMNPKGKTKKDSDLWLWMKHANYLWSGTDLNLVICHTFSYIYNYTHQDGCYCKKIILHLDSHLHLEQVDFKRFIQHQTKNPGKLQHWICLLFVLFRSPYCPEVMKMGKEEGKEKRKKKGEKKEGRRKRKKKEGKREQLSESGACVFRLRMPLSKQCARNESSKLELQCGICLLCVLVRTPYWSDEEGRRRWKRKKGEEREEERREKKGEKKEGRREKKERRRKGKRKKWEKKEGRKKEGRRRGKRKKEEEREKERRKKKGGKKEGGKERREKKGRKKEGRRKGKGKKREEREKDRRKKKGEKKEDRREQSSDSDVFGFWMPWTKQWARKESSKLKLQYGICLLYVLVRTLYWSDEEGGGLGKRKKEEEGEKERSNKKGEERRQKRAVQWLRGLCFQIVDAIQQAVSQAGVKLAVLDHIPSNVPVILPLGELIPICHQQWVYLQAEGVRCCIQPLPQIGLLCHTSVSMSVSTCALHSLGPCRQPHAYCAWSTWRRNGCRKGTVGKRIQRAGVGLGGVGVEEVGVWRRSWKQT